MAGGNCVLYSDRNHTQSNVHLAPPPPKG
jgi:hypothetical protein